MSKENQKGTRPNRPLRWGILGTAQIAREIIRATRLSKTSQLEAIASRDIEKAQQWAGEFSIPLAFGSYDELLESGKVDLIYIPLPNSLHAQWTMKAIQAGYPVLCEKPLASNAAEAQAVMQTAKEKGLHVAEGYMYRFHPQYSRVLELIESGAIGEVTTLHSQFTFMLDDPDAIPASKSLAGGALMDVGCYCVNFTRLIAGCEPFWVSAFEKRDEVDVTMVGLLEFPNNILAHFETSIGNYERHRAEIAGTTGSILLDDPWIPGDKPAIVRVFREGKNPEEVMIPAADSYLLEIDNFVSVCLSGESPRWPISDAVANMEVLDALFASAKERKAIGL